MKRLIIAHGDGDGVISAAVLKKQFPFPEIIFTQPFLLGKVVIPEEVEEIYVVDIAVDNRNPQQTIDFATAHAEKIKLWADHHVGGEILTEILGLKFLFDPKMPSCPALLKQAGFDVPIEWLDTANASDRPTEFTQTELSKLYNEAFKVSLVELQDGNRLAVEKVQSQFVDYLLTGEIGQLKSYAERYAPLLQNTKNAVSGMAELIPGVVGYIKLGDEAVDKTAIFTEAYKKFSFVVLQSVSAENGECVTTVATNTKTNLVELFDLKSGAPFRINLSQVVPTLGWKRPQVEIQLEKAKDTLAEMLFQEALKKANEEAKKLLEENKVVLPSFEEAIEQEGNRYGDGDITATVIINGAPTEVSWGEDGPALEYKAWEEKGMLDWKVCIPYEILRISWGNPEGDSE